VIVEVAGPETGPIWLQLPVAKDVKVLVSVDTPPGGQVVEPTIVDVTVLL
jgi:hypothetical protein